jgi:hypothetical protein
MPLFLHSKMACSKIFSEDIPELLYEIIKYYKNDYSTLHFCVLVNRLWCRLAIPLLWENPFSLLFIKDYSDIGISLRNYNVIGIYLHNLNGGLRTKLDKYGINDDILPSNTLFNYPIFLKYLNSYEIILSIKKWANEAHKFSNYANLSKNNLKSSLSRFEELIYMSLFKIFFDSEVSLHTLEIRISSNWYVNNIIELILQNTNFIRNIRYLELYILDGGLIKDRITQMINTHQNPKKFFFSDVSFPLYQPLLLSKDSNYSNTLNTIILYNINFKDMTNLDKIFEQLNVLESVHIINCTLLNTDFTQQIISLTKPFKLKSLFIDDNEMSEFESLQLLLQKSGNYIENFECNLSVYYDFSIYYDLLPKQQNFESIVKYCKNIRFLSLLNVEEHFTLIIFKLIENIKQSLNYLLIKNNHYDINISSIILQNLFLIN